jgi:hypothetical protein
MSSAPISEQQFNIHNMPPGSSIKVNDHTVEYDEHQPLGDNGKPARGYSKGTYRVETPKGKVSYHDTSPFRKNESSQRGYTADMVRAYVNGGPKAPRGNLNIDRH